MSRSLRVLVLGGTRFIGRALVMELLGCGHEVAVVHRGEHEGGLPAEVLHIHTDRSRLPARREELASFAPDVAVDLSAMTAADAEVLAATLDPSVPLVAASSADVYRAFGSLHEGVVTDPVPLREDAPLRTGPPPDRVVMAGWSYEADRYEKLDVERIYLERGATICRLPVVYGEHDYKRREEFVLSRVRAGCDRIPIGAGTLLLSRGYAPEIARALRLAAERAVEGARNEIFNLAEPETATVRLWMQEILAAAGHEAELVRVPEERLPEDLGFTAEFQQPLVLDCSKAERELGWVHAPWRTCVANSVRWHLANPPQEARPG
ncbi:MAG TPA: NAD-dependent epimerase/dehydratase family protein [Solirubrobacterales bacterium]|nr:NAD-dependent epimerase/dehydratase family protein [Solirubrobacterales bacterium]